jgi:hypothetical protein
MGLRRNRRGGFSMDRRSRRFGLPAWNRSSLTLLRFFEKSSYFTQSPVKKRPAVVYWSLETMRRPVRPGVPRDASGSIHFDTTIFGEYSLHASDIF